MKITRRLVNSGTDILGKAFRRGDLIVTATQDTLRKPRVGLALAVVNNIYSDDQNGDPYYREPVYYRDSEGNFSVAPPHSNNWEPISPVGDPDDYIRITPKAKTLHSQYKGDDEIVARYAYKVTTIPVTPDGKRVGGKAIYGMENILRVRKGYWDETDFGDC